MKRVRMTIVHEFDYHGDLTMEAADRLCANFMSDPTAFLHPHELEWDEVLLIDLEDITDGME